MKIVKDFPLLLGVHSQARDAHNLSAPVDVNVSLRGIFEENIALATEEQAQKKKEPKQVSERLSRQIQLFRTPQLERMCRGCSLLYLSALTTDNGAKRSLDSLGHDSMRHFCS